MIRIFKYIYSFNFRQIKKVLTLIIFVLPSFIFAQDSLDVRWLGGYPFARAYRPTAGIINGHKYCFLTAGAGVLIFNIDNPDSTVKVSQITSKVDRPHTFFTNNLLYLADKSEGLKIYDLLNPSLPRLLGGCDADNSVADVFVKDDHAYVVDSDHLRVINISDPSIPYEEGSCFVPNYPNSVDMKDNYVYCGTFYGDIIVVDVFNPTNPFVCFDTTTWANIFDITVHGDYLFVPDWFGWTFIFDISNAQHPIYCGMVEGSGIGTSVEVYGNYLYRPIGDSALGRGLAVYDITDVSTPIMVGHVPITESTSDGLVYLDGYIYLANDLDGLRVINVQDPYNPYETGFYQTPGFAKCIFISNNIAYLGSEKLISIIDVSDPQNCIDLGTLELENDINNIWVNNSYAYTTDTIGGLSIIDVSDPLHPVQTGYYLLPSYWGSKGVWVQDTFAYVTYFGTDEGLRAINVADKYNPYEVGSCSVTTQWNTLGSGNYVYCTRSSILQIVDIQNPSAPYLAASLQACNGNLTINNDHIYIAAGSLCVIDISDPLNSFVRNIVPYSFHDVFASGDYAYGVRICGTSQGKILTVLNISNPDSIYEVGYYNAPASGYYYGDRVFYDNGYTYVCQWHLGLHIYEFYGTGIEETNAQVIPKNLQVKNLKNHIEFSYYLKNPSKVKVSLIDVLGKVVEKQNVHKPRGNHKGEISKKKLACGVYFLLVETKNWSYSEKIVIIK